METEDLRLDNKVPYRAVHPFEIIQDELAARHIPRREFAERIGVGVKELRRMFNERQAITPDLAERIAAALPGIPSSTWTGMQRRYEQDVKAIAGRDRKGKRK